MPTAFLCLFLAASPVFARENTGKGATVSKLEQGQRLFNQGEFDGALKSLDTAVAEASDASTLERAHLLRGQCYAAKQEFTKAEDAFAAALEANPDASLDPARVDPSVVKMLDAMRARMQGELSVRSTPAGAAVSVDGKSVGVAPLTVSVSIGKHKIEAKWADGPSATADVTARAKQMTYVEWVQGANATVIAPEAGKRIVRPYADVRVPLEFDLPGGFDSGIEVGGGIEVPYTRFGLGVRFPQFGVIPRAAVVVPIVDRFSAFIEVAVPLAFAQGFSVGLGGAGGAEWAPSPWIGVFAQLGGNHLFLHPYSNVNDLLVLSAGVRLRLP